MRTMKRVIVIPTKIQSHSCAHRYINHKSLSHGVDTVSQTAPTLAATLNWTSETVPIAERTNAVPTTMRNP